MGGREADGGLFLEQKTAWMSLLSFLPAFWMIEPPTLPSGPAAGAGPCELVGAGLVLLWGLVLLACGGGRERRPRWCRLGRTLEQGGEEAFPLDPQIPDSQDEDRGGDGAWPEVEKPIGAVNGRMATVHDLKTPLLGIRQLADILLQTESLTKDGRRELALIRAAAVEAMDRIDDLIAEAKDAARGRDWESVDVAEVADQVVRRFQPHAEAKKQALYYQAPSDPCLVRGNGDRLREATSNLVSNAVKFSPPGGAICVTVEPIGSRIRLSVSDNGPGLGLEDQRNLFKPFRSLGPGPTGEERSSGLGLYLTHQIAKEHGGNVVVATAKDKGSTFSIVVPALSSVPA